MALVSIIVPVYAVEDYLRPCVDSILDQDFRDLEVILVDDGSPDNCPAICDEFARKDPRVRVIHKKNGGVSSARNQGLEAACGTYITFCDSDDGYGPGWLRGLVEGMEQGADVVVAGHRKCYPDGSFREVCHETGTWELPDVEKRLEYCMDLVLTDRHAWEIWSRMFRGDIIRAHGLRFCETCGNFSEDLGFVLQYSLYAGRVRCIAGTGYHYTIRQNSMMGSSVAVPKLNSVNEVSLEFLDRLKREFPQGEPLAPVRHFLIMMNQYSVAIRLEAYRNIRTYVGQIRQKQAWEDMTRRIFSCRDFLTEKYGRINAGRIRIYSRYCLHGCWLWFKIQRFLLFKLNGYRD